MTTAGSQDLGDNCSATATPSIRTVDIDLEPPTRRSRRMAGGRQTGRQYLGLHDTTITGAEHCSPDLTLGMVEPVLAGVSLAVGKAVRQPQLAIRVGQVEPTARVWSGCSNRLPARSRSGCRRQLGILFRTTRWLRGNAR